MTGARTGTGTLAAVLLAAAAAGGCSGGDALPGSVGSPAPAFEAETLEGDTVALADLRGSPVLINIWATWCPPCREETPDLQAFHEAHRDRGLEVVGVSIDNAAAHDAVRQFVDEYDVTYTILLDPAESISDAFRIRGVPTSVLVGPDGTVLWRRVGQVRPQDDEQLQRALTEALGRGSGERAAAAP